MTRAVALGRPPLIIRRFPRNRHIVRMQFNQPRVGDAFVVSAGEIKYRQSRSAKRQLLYRTFAFTTEY